MLMKIMMTINLVIMICKKSLLNDIMSSLELETYGYAVTDVRNMLNVKLQAKGIGNYISAFPLQDSH